MKSRSRRFHPNAEPLLRDCEAVGLFPIFLATARLGLYSITCLSLLDFECNPRSRPGCLPVNQSQLWAHRSLSRSPPFTSFSLVNLRLEFSLDSKC